MNIRRQLIRILCVIALILSLAGCGFRKRSADDIPPQLHHVYLDTTNPYSVFTTQFASMLKALNITLDKTHDTAPYTIKISGYKFLQSNPAITTTSLAATFTYSLDLDVSILSRSGKIIAGPKSLAASRSIVQIASQVYTPGTATLAKQELRRDMISQIYYFLISENTRHALQAPTKHHVH